MDRYRSYAPPDDLPIQEGDDSLVGVNTYDSPENVQRGQVQEATNIDFTTQDAQTRGGFVCLPELGSSPFGFAWTAQSTIVSDQWIAVAYGNGLFAATASNGGGAFRVMTSPDGATWTGRAAAENNNWAAICFGGGLFVAVSSAGFAHLVMTSPDGITWAARTEAAAIDWRSVAWGVGIFVAVGGNSGSAADQVMTSPDGVTWTSRSATSSAQWNSVTYGGGVFVAVGSNPSGSVMTSPDGITWTARTAAENNSWRSVTYGNGLFVAVSSNGTNRVMTSPDGIAWTARTAASAIVWGSVSFGNGVFAALSNVGTTGASMTSYNGITWATQATPTSGTWTAITYGAGFFVGVASTGTASSYAMTSNSLQNVYGSGIYSDPSDPGSQWVVLVGQTKVGMFSFGKTSKIVSYAAGETVTEQSTIVQCNNLVYLFRGPNDTPLYWSGSWADNFELAPTPTPGAGFEIIPNSNQATYYQNRLWVKNGKDVVSASDVLDFTKFEELANEFNLNTGDSNFLVTTYPFGTTTLLVFKNRSILALTAVDGALTDVVSTEITRQVGAIGINAVVSVGPDVVYMSDRNINLITLTDTSNALQHKTLPLSRNIQGILARVNWQAASKVSLGFNDNKLYVALPLDNSTVCNTVCVYNFVTEQWFGEWNFADSLGIGIQGWAVASYLGVQRMHCITEDGRIFVTGEGPNDISGTTVAEISTSLTTRAYRMDNNNRINRRMWLDLGTNRPNFSVTSYVDGASESSQILTDKTYTRSQSWIFADAAYDLTNANDDYNRAGRKDYASGPASIQAQSGFLPEMLQEYRFPIITRGKGRLTWFRVTNTQGFISINGIGGEARAGDRSNLVQVL